MGDGVAHAGGPGTPPGSPSTTVTPDHVRALLEHAAGEERVLIVIQGRVEVVAAARLRDPAYEGALEVASTQDLDAMSALSPPQKADPEILASVLQAAISRLGA
ncbi:hypothetical protein GCM10010347_21140 [Streptomyces cirratus]|uniref:Uncharacterized protein n=1 Tax=Streptomyces cirratus TaxID=68187 RepID=A0ABQ3ESN4_9ACTN|nr:hypothetical protein [Streptomyces cirratus]GHB51167.1 hypothetical protein GCM10010347_21140 [Streptomyces cirratus]